MKTEQLRNWAGNYAFKADQLVEPDDLVAAQSAVAKARRIRALGTRHSFNDLADSDGTLVSVLRMPPEIELDEQRSTVSFSAGTRYGALASWLNERGYALHNMGSLPHISVAGAISTGTHGSGDLNGNLSSAVRGLLLIKPDGGLRWVRQGDDDFNGSVVALGLLGVIVRIELAVEPSYLVRQDVYCDLAWRTLLADVSAVTSSGYSVSIFTNWVSDSISQVWVKRRVTDQDQPVPDLLLGAHRDIAGTAVLIESEADNTTQRGVATSWSDALPHFRIDSTPSNGDEIQTEYFVDHRDAATALRAVRGLGEAIAPHLLTSEIRTIAADDLWLSPAYGRHSLAIHFTWKNEPEAVLALCPRIEAALSAFSPRPHWGKVHTMNAVTVAREYPRFADFVRLAKRVDPAQKFVGPHTARVLEAAE